MRSIQSLLFDLLGKPRILTELSSPEDPRLSWQTMRPNVNVNATSEHALYLQLFVTNGGGW